jgi:hypothetical protein
MPNEGGYLRNCRVPPGSEGSRVAYGVSTSTLVRFHAQYWKEAYATPPPSAPAQPHEVQPSAATAARSHQIDRLPLVVVRKRPTLTSFHPTPPGSSSLLQVSINSEEVHLVHLPRVGPASESAPRKTLRGYEFSKLGVVSSFQAGRKDPLPPARIFATLNPAGSHTERG